MELFQEECMQHCFREIYRKDSGKTQLEKPLYVPTTKLDKQGRDLNSSNRL